MKFSSDERKVLLALVVQDMANGKQTSTVLDGLVSKLSKGEAPTRRGFASWSPEKQREVASRGGKAAHFKGTAHHFSVDEAREAGKIGGASVSRNSAWMSEIGRKGGVMGGVARRQESARRKAAAEAEEEANQTKQS